MFVLRCIATVLDIMDRKQDHYLLEITIRTIQVRPLTVSAMIIPVEGQIEILEAGKGYEFLGAVTNEVLQTETVTAAPSRPGRTLAWNSASDGHRCCRQDKRGMNGCVVPDHAFLEKYSPKCSRRISSYSRSFTTYSRLICSSGDLSPCINSW
ncbi:hypothetical protein DFS34DRAFT_196874 [Phlyctochytrium arcticum]|nr:hypothetical protein DFS34DRAFT_196874 [Phlyctochytrium arcticum]